MNKSQAIGCLAVLITALQLTPQQTHAEQTNLFTGGGFSDRLLDEIECRHIKRSTPMSAHPVDSGLGPTTALDRQFGRMSARRSGEYLGAIIENRALKIKSWRRC